LSFPEPPSLCGAAPSYLNVGLKCAYVQAAGLPVAFAAYFRYLSWISTISGHRVYRRSDLSDQPFMKLEDIASRKWTEAEASNVKNVSGMADIFSG